MKRIFAVGAVLVLAGQAIALPAGDRTAIRQRRQVDYGGYNHGGGGWYNNDPRGGGWRQRHGGGTGYRDIQEDNGGPFRETGYVPRVVHGDVEDWRRQQEQQKKQKQQYIDERLRHIEGFLSQKHERQRYEDSVRQQSPKQQQHNQSHQHKPQKRPPSYGKPNKSPAPSQASKQNPGQGNVPVKGTPQQGSPQQGSPVPPVSGTGVSHNTIGAAASTPSTSKDSKSTGVTKDCTARNSPQHEHELKRTMNSGPVPEKTYFPPRYSSKDPDTKTASTQTARAPQGQR